MAQRILIVEDDPMNVKFMSVVLKRKGGFEIIVSEDPDEIMSIAREAAPSAVIMDISLSNSRHRGEKVDGIYITKMLKADPKTAAIPVILATAHAMIGDREHLLEASKADYYMSKPFSDPVLFVQEVTNVINSYSK